MVFGFDRTDQFRGEVLEELANLRGRGLIRLVDLFVAVKDKTGEVLAVELNDLTKKESVKFGKVVGKLLGKQKDHYRRSCCCGGGTNTWRPPRHSVGLDYRGIGQIGEGYEAGEGVRRFLMIEHVWAIPLRNAVRRAGGIPLAQGFLTPEAVMMVGEELETIVEAERTIEVAQAVQAAAILDTLATLEEADAIKTAIVADVVRTLAIAEVIEEAAIQDALETLEAAGMLEDKYLAEARKDEEKKAAEDKKIFAVPADAV